MQTLEIITLKFGEKKNIPILVSSTYGGTFEITNATFQLMIGDTVEASGACEVEQLNMSECIVKALCEPLRKNATYKLIYWYDIYPQRLTYECLIRVI